MAEHFIDLKEIPEELAAYGRGDHHGVCGIAADGSVHSVNAVRSDHDTTIVTTWFGDEVPIVAAKVMDKYKLFG